MNNTYKVALNLNMCAGELRQILQDAVTFVGNNGWTNAEKDALYKVATGIKELDEASEKAMKMSEK